MKLQETGIQILPDVHMFGGDTTPWRCYLKHASGAGYTVDDAVGYTVTMYILPYYMQSGFNVSGEPILSMNGVIEDVNGFAAAIFEFEASDTISLAGKYIYQIEVNFGREKRLGQGSLYIRPNIYRGG